MTRELFTDQTGNIRYRLHYDLKTRFAVPDDAPQIWQFICDLAEYEHDRDQVRVTAEILKTQMESEHPPFECLIAEWQSETVGFALFCTKYSTWEGVETLWLEDIYVKPEVRGRHVGCALLHHLQEIVRKREYGRIEWWVLNWNQPAIRFYESLGAIPMKDWTVWRINPKGAPQPRS